MISATMQSQQSSSLSSSMITSHQQQNQQALSSTGAESQQHDPDTLRIVENAIRIATGLPATGGAQLTTPPPHIAQYIDSMTARHQCQEHFQEECAKHQQQVQKEGNEVQAQGSTGGFSFSFKASTSSSSSNSAGTAVETRDRGLFGAESSGASIETTEEQTKDRGLFGFRKWVGKKVHGGTTTTAISSDAAQFEHEAGTTIEPTDSMLSTTSTTTSMMTVTDTNVGSANATAACGQATDQVQVTCQQPPECLGPMSSGEVITMSRRSSISSSSSDDSDQGLGRRHRIKTKIGGMLGLSSSATSSSVQYQQQQEGSEHHEQTCVTSSADLYSQQCHDQLHDSSAEWSSTVHYAVTPSGQVVLDASGPSATMHQGSFAYPTGPSSTTMVGAAAVGGMVGAGIGAAAASGATAGASSQESQWTVVNHAATSSGLSATHVQQATARHSKPSNLRKLTTNSINISNSNSNSSNSNKPAWRSLQMRPCRPLGLPAPPK
ncbi:hypothetical protein BCR44DRAFT_1136237 [Catenaria anguillulae PL171]|uniref:Uncharacterized protein n=1 Tax=Catenaria anguillulae PL171 TaxID=765915 RepID=A0A1Y2HJX4_9FUNG|nr:hypothetical protein BCR44DRAFT_1136237 [Catenaria anguillulae PL171]